MIPTRIKINLIGFAVISAGLIFAMATQVLTILKPRISVDAIFPDAGGVFTNQEVTYRGITVGQVGEMEVIEDGVRIELLIDDEWDIPSEGIEARVMFKSAVGEQFVDLLPTTDGEPFLEDGDTIPMERTSIPVSTQALLSTLEAVLRGVPPEDLKGAVDALGIGLTGRGPDLATIVESTADIATVLAEHAPEIEGILQDGTDVGGAFVRSREDFARAIRELVTVSDTLGDNTDAIERLLRGSNLVSDELVALLRQRRGELDMVLEDLAEVNTLSADHAGDLDRLLVDLPVALSNVVRAFEPDTGLIRFGPVVDAENPPCGYGTPRRTPADRSPKLPPKNARCGADRPATGGGASVATPPARLRPSLLRGSGTTLPPHMSEWSWTLFYLNAL